MNLSDSYTVRKILNKFGFQFSKLLGQNFIVDADVCPEMALRCCDDQDSAIIEVGPGIGVLTVELAKRFKKVVSVEIDERLIPVLKYTTSEFANLKILNSDILKIDLQKLIQNEFSGFKKINVCANLPYYITSDIIMYILENDKINIDSLTLMLQKEAAERICAKPGTRNSGAISLAVRYYGEPKILFEVNRECFMPVPNVDSCVIRIDLSKSASKKVENKNNFFKVVKGAYSQRRKNLLNALSSYFSVDKSFVKMCLDKASVNSSFRAEQVDFEGFARIAAVMFNKDVK